MPVFKLAFDVLSDKGISLRFARSLGVFNDFLLTLIRVAASPEIADDFFDVCVIEEAIMNVY